MVWGQDLCGGISSDPENPTLPTTWGYGYQFQGHCGLSNVLRYSMFPLCNIV